ncbi:MAG: hypothetical protein IPG02_13155 [Ignavibacteria bacterium]|nr:hypothetical protein [Ignavibacteria bacterium]
MANPIASLISVPFQSTFQFGIGGMDGYRYLMNLQPVIPVSLGKGLNLINRIIVPVVVQNRAVDMERQNGLGDIVYSAFFSPASGGLTWGVGPAFSIPTATNELLGSKKLLIARSPGSWTVGMLANNPGQLQEMRTDPILIHYSLSPLLHIILREDLDSEHHLKTFMIGRNKRLASGLVALNLTQVFKFGSKQVASFVAAPVYYYSSNAVNRPEWGAKFALTLVFPK